MSKLATQIFRIPFVKKRWERKFQSIEFDSIPWAPLTKSLNTCKTALITTGGVHLKTDKPFNMVDKNGDPTYRVIPSSTQSHDLMTTHDYYDHRDADRDINLVFPIDILRECQEEGLLGESADYFYSFMGHIKGPHVKTLMEKTAKKVAGRLTREGVDITILIPS